MELLSGIEQTQSTVIRSIGVNKAQTKSFYRFLDNNSVELSEVINYQLAGYNLLEQKGHILCINDTTEINLQAHIGRLNKENLGFVGHDKGIGFFFHPTLLMRAENAEFVGFSSLQIWTRDFDKLDKHERNYSALEVSEKESYKWIQAMKDSSEQLKNASMITIIADRESDLYEEFQQLPNTKTHLLIRSSTDRCLYESDKKLYETLDNEVVTGTYEIKIPTENRKQQVKRVATVSVKFCSVKLKKPKKVKKGQDFVSVYAIEVKEQNPPDGIEPICWRLLTTHLVDSYEAAIQLINFYKLRWWIETLFRTLKKQGLNIEGSQIENGEAIKKLCVYALPTALKIMQLAYAKNDNEVSIDTCFNQEEQACLKAILPKIDGKTSKQQNPYDPSKLAWATWIIARLGGWGGIPSQRPAGVITLYKGLDRFNNMFEGWSILYKDVGTQ